MIHAISKNSLKTEVFLIKKLIIFVSLLSMLFVLTVPSFAISLDNSVVIGDNLDGSFALKPSINYGLSTSYTVGIIDSSNNVYNRLTTLTDGSIILSDTTNTNYPPRLLYDKDGYLKYNGFISFIYKDAQYTPSVLLNMLNGQTVINGSYSFNGDANTFITLVQDFPNFIYNDVLYVSATYYNNVLVFVEEDGTPLQVIDNGNFVIPLPITITFEDNYLPSAVNAKLFYDNFIPNFSSDNLTETVFFGFNKEPSFYLPNFSVQINGIDNNNNNFGDFAFSNNYIYGFDENGTLHNIYNGYEYSSSLIAFTDTYSSAFNLFGSPLESLEGNTRYFEFEFTLGSTNTNNFFYTANMHNVFLCTTVPGDLTGFAANTLIVYDNVMYLYNSNYDEFYTCKSGDNIRVRGHIPYALFNVLSNSGDIIYDNSFDGDIGEFFEDLFSLPERAMTNLVLFETDTGTTITLFTVVSTAISLAFIFWILKMIAGG